MCSVLLSHTVDSWLFILSDSITTSLNIHCMSHKLDRVKTFFCSNHMNGIRRKSNEYFSCDIHSKLISEKTDSWWVSGFPSIAEMLAAVRWRWVMILNMPGKKSSNFPSSSANLNQASKSVCWMFISVGAECNFMALENWALVWQHLNRWTVWLKLFSFFSLSNHDYCVASS